MKKILSILISLALILGSVSTAFANDASPDEAARDGNTIFVSAREIGESSFAEAVQLALYSARDKADDNNIFTVKVEEGEYELSRAMRIFSNTTLNLEGVTVKRIQGISSNMLRIGTEDAPSEGVVGYAYKNISIEGGVFDADNTVKTMIKAAHARNFSMKNVTLKNLRLSHMIEVAGVDGLTFQNCRFENQLVEKAEDVKLCYEAIQLDVLKSGHIVNCRSEDLPIKNVLVEGCTFDNCPRGVGSHTAVLNAPFDNIVIRHNSFTNMASAAVQTMNWTNCQITDNYIENSPRGIAVYTTGSNGKGMFTPSEFAEEGSTETHYSDEYTAPADSKTVISNNILKNIGGVEDVLASYAVSAVSLIGFDLTSKAVANEDTDADTEAEAVSKIPAGNYYVSGVTVRDNYIDVKGSGIRLDNVRNTDVISNVLYCGNNSFKPDSKYHGIFTRYSSQLGYIKNNYINNAKFNAIQVSEGCSVDSICYNDVDTASNYGIVGYNAKINSINNNRVLNTAKGGIGVNDGTVVPNNVSRNKVLSSPVGVNITKISQVTLNCNTLSCSTPVKYNFRSLIIDQGRQLGNIFSTTAQESGVFADVKSLELKTGDCYRLCVTETPLNAFAKFTYTSSNEDVAEVGKDGMIIAKGEGSTQVTVKTEKGVSTTVDVKVNSTGEAKSTPADKITMINSAVNSGASVYLNWEKVSGAVRYRVYRKTTGAYQKIAEVSSGPYSDKNVVSGTTYYYTVRALDKNSNFIGAYDTTGTKVLYVAPAALNELKNNVGKIKVGWNKTAGVSKYKVMYKYNGSDWLAFTTTANTSKYLDKTLSGRAYSFIIIGLDASGNPLNTYNKVGWTRKYLSKPTLKSSVKKKKVTFTWKAVTGASKYMLYGTANGKWKKLKTTKKTTCAYTGKYGKTYSFMLRCADGSLKHFSEYSNQKVVKIKKPKPKKTKKSKKTAKKTTKKSS